MSCCGKKRKEWSESKNSSVDHESEVKNSNSFDNSKSGRIFEYTGTHPKSIKGIITGKSYLFKFKGHRLEVNYYDSMAFMAERDLKLVPQ